MEKFIPFSTKASASLFFTEVLPLVAIPSSIIILVLRRILWVMEKQI